MVGCVFSREVWFGLLKRADFLFLIAQQEDCFEDWWLRSRKRTTKDVCKGFDTLVVLTALEIWKERDGRVFNHISH
jgi:hypothetical protein